MQEYVALLRLPVLVCMIRVGSGSPPYGHPQWRAHADPGPANASRRVGTPCPRGFNKPITGQATAPRTNANTPPPRTLHNSAIAKPAKPWHNAAPRAVSSVG